ncbi:hypothetical protein IFM89_033524 [Coptis chinensis]|uniref:PHP n=1 Tax=Coptis chinensis TaxID=261450 RepID=A0A835H842_9MAGN|nr:hypothetical protein IFM89_033524 [Coptis chinensis]
MDPLSALRDLTIRGELDKIVKVNDEFRFGSDYIFPCSAETAYRSKQGNLYTLETLVYYVNNHSVKHTEYLQNARLQKLPAVTLPDRKPLLEYLQGKVLSNDAIQFVVPQNPNPVVEDSPVFCEEEKLEVSESVADYVLKIKGMERPLRDREALLECRDCDFHTALTTLTKKEEERQRVESQQRKDGLVAKSRLMGSDGDDLGYDMAPKPKINFKGSKIGEGVPIILVPSAFQTLITIYNVKEFLEDGVFIPTDVKVKQMKGARPDCITVQKKFSRDGVVTVTAYEVRDKPSALKAEDWDRVVAVFVLGKEWQFKDWPFKDHVEIFNKIIGFFMRFEDDSVESAKNVKQWNVKIISWISALFVHSVVSNYCFNMQISKNKRHQDRAAALEVWDRLEEFVRSRSRSHT